MTSRRRLPRELAIASLVLPALIGALGCHWVFPHNPRTSPAYLCGGAITEYARIYPPPDPANVFQVYGVGQVQEVVFTGSDVGVPPKLYMNREWTPTVDGFPWQLKGTHLVRVSNVNQGSDKDVFLEVRLQADIHELIVAFDTRATSHRRGSPRTSRGGWAWSCVRPRPTCPRARRARERTSSTRSGARHPPTRRSTRGPSRWAATTRSAPLGRTARSARST